MNIVYASSQGLLPHLEAPIKSLLDHNKDVMVYVLTEVDTLPFEIPCKHKIINISNQQYFPKNGPNMKSFFTYIPMIRVCLPEILKANKVICLDVDTIICDSLKPIWDIDLTDKWIAWCPEYLGTYRPYGKQYYNIGVAVYNLAQMRKEKVSGLAVNLLNTNHYLYLDQDVMNQIAVPDKSVDIPVRYNECFCCGYTDAPAIVHYAGIPDWPTNWTAYRREYLDRYLG